MSTAAEHVLCSSSSGRDESEARALLASLPAREVIVLAEFAGMSNADVRAEIVEHMRVLIDQAKRQPGQAHELEATLRAKGDKVRGPVRAKLSIPSKPWPR